MKGGEVVKDFENLDDILQHFGVKGMKWGVRKDKDRINSKDRTIRKGTEVQNITSRPYQERNRHLYAAYTSYDKTAYGEMMGIFMYTDKSFKNDFKVKKDIKVPSDKVLVENFISLAKKNPKMVSSDMAKAYNDLSIFTSRKAKHFEKKISKVEEPISKRGEKLTKQYLSLMVSDKASKSRAEFFGGIMKKGYDAISDVNDRDPNAGTQDPLIILNPKKSLGKVKTMQLTKADLDKYWKTVNFDNDYQKSRTDLKEVQT